MRQVRKEGTRRQRLQNARGLRPRKWTWEPVLTGDPRPQRERQLSPQESSLADKQAAEWLLEDVVEEADANQAWVNNLVFVQKKTGGVRVCVDCTPANEVTEPYRWPIPRLQDLRHRLAGANRLSRIDLRNAFFRIDVPKQYRYLTAFRARGRTYWFKKMPFGLTTAPEVFQHMMDVVLAPHRQYAFWYIDDILIWGKNSEELARREAMVRQDLSTNAQTINDAKSVSDQEEILFAGLHLTPRSIGPNHEKVKELLALPPPRTKAGARSALGLASYLREFIPLASLLTARISGEEIPEQEYEEEWSKFRLHLRHTITHLAKWDETRPADLYTDASKVACGAILIQDGRIVATASRKFTPAETRYSATDREHLGLVLACRKFRIFIQRQGGLTTVHTDHQALLSRRVSELTPRQARWRWEITNNIPQLNHVKGLKNPADFFSRGGALGSWGPVLSIKS